MVNSGLMCCAAAFPFASATTSFAGLMLDTSQILASAKRSIAAEAEGLSALLTALDGSLAGAFAKAVAVISEAQGRVIVSGMGKSGHIARKIAATFASTGTPALFVHPAEASHGDLGMITQQDVVVMISNSGESAELRAILDYTQRFAVPLIAVTASPFSALAKTADVALILPQAPEACPNGLAPTTSTLLQLALGDALAIALLEAKGFTALNFRDFHPGGKLGAQLRHVSDIMRQGEALPLAKPFDKMADALVVMTEKACGCLGIVDDQAKLIGIITDGDLRRHMRGDLLDQNASAIMTPAPKTITRETLAAEALELLNSARITSVFVVDGEGRPAGLVHIHDLLRTGVG
jgi:arabinose-5-phosphate isomerase